MLAADVVPPFEAVQFLQSRRLPSPHAAAFSRLDETLSALTERLQPAIVMELGGGRSPRYDTSSRTFPFRFVVNDISDSELSLLPQSTATAAFDISDPAGVPDAYVGAIDFAFSRSVLEHVSSVDEAMRTTHRLLRPGGVAFHFFPTLYASPFVINKLIPFGLSRPLVERISRPQYTRFPALYRQATSTSRRLERWKAIGFREVSAARFYGHNYYNRLPIVRELERLISGTAAKRNWAWYSSFAYVLMVK